ncbi:hypothetical protein CCMSSC00406_0006794 [Pleurotus cornucopiae]|uniref:Uncharacterized protein n=1 Tax=Pleurotus cornucopiae TaxID=5321 RepID=A0ACB7J1Y6_PLECO|nr:hypothetical protein CCMSSC00406_0006794 [Pleurotus cornucopiae]
MLNDYDILVVNGFVFCSQHGHECCSSCVCDFREQNNAQIEDDICLDAGLDLAQRKSLNIFDVGAVRHRKESQTCKCETHFDVDCERCFDWVKICIAEMTGNPLPGKVKRLKWPVEESEMHL